VVIFDRAQILGLVAVLSHLTMAWMNLNGHLSLLLLVWKVQKQWVPR